MSVPWLSPGALSQPNTTVPQHEPLMPSTRHKTSPVLSVPTYTLTPEPEHATPGMSYQNKSTEEKEKKSRHVTLPGPLSDFLGELDNLLKFIRDSPGTTMRTRYFKDYCATNTQDKWPIKLGEDQKEHYFSNPFFGKSDLMQQQQQQQQPTFTRTWNQPSMPLPSAPAMDSFGQTREMDNSRSGGMLKLDHHIYKDQFNTEQPAPKAEPQNPNLNNFHQRHNEQTMNGYVRPTNENKPPTPTQKAPNTLYKVHTIREAHFSGVQVVIINSILLTISVLMALYLINKHILQ